MNKKEVEVAKISDAEGVKIALRQGAQIIATMVASLHPEWGMMLATGSAIIGAWGEFGQTRVNELVTFISEHKDEFAEDIIKSDTFKTLFLNILERHIKEASEEKRKLLRNYLLAVGRGVNPDFNEFSRMNNILDTISLDEIDLLRFWDEDGVLTKRMEANAQMRQMSVTIGDLQSAVYNMNPRVPELMSLIDKGNDSKNNQIMMSLTYKGLLYGLMQDNFGSGQEIRVKEITPFGKAFLAFIRG